MTDDKIERLIKDELKKRDITFYDMIGMRGYGVDPEPEGKTNLRRQRIRENRFNAFFGSDRMEEILSKREYSPYDHLPPLKVAVKDLFRFWWNRCVEKDMVIEDILEDIYEYFKEQMRPEEKEEERDLKVDFKWLSPQGKGDNTKKEGKKEEKK